MDYLRTILFISQIQIANDHVHALYIKCRYCIRKIIKLQFSNDHYINVNRHILAIKKKDYLYVYAGMFLFVDTHIVYTVR